jgi:hypothetical protein
VDAGAAGATGVLADEVNIRAAAAAQPATATAAPVWRTWCSCGGLPFSLC